MWLIYSSVTIYHNSHHTTKAACKKAQSKTFPSEGKGAGIIFANKEDPLFIIDRIVASMHVLWRIG